MNSSEGPALSRACPEPSRRVEGPVLSRVEGMLYSIILKHAPTRAMTIHATMDHQAHAAFLRTVRELDATGEPRIYRKTRIRDTLIRAVPPIRGY